MLAEMDYFSKYNEELKGAKGAFAKQIRDCLQRACGAICSENFPLFVFGNSPEDLKLKFNEFVEEIVNFKSLQLPAIVKGCRNN
jgi:hypothetical protein